MRWERRHHEVMDAMILDLARAGTEHALGEMGLTEATPLPQTQPVRDRLSGRFEITAIELTATMRRGTVRSAGLIDLLKERRTLGAVSLFIRRLTDAVRPSLELLAERASWIAYAEGYRLAAIEGAHALLLTANAMPPPGMPLSAATIPSPVLATLPRYAWAGPQDREPCGACADRRGYVTYALSVDEMPACQDVCGLRDACRHFYMRVPTVGE